MKASVACKYLAGLALLTGCAIAPPPGATFEPDALAAAYEGASTYREGSVASYGHGDPHQCACEACQAAACPIANFRHAPPAAPPTPPPYADPGPPAQFFPVPVRPVFYPE